MRAGHDDPRRRYGRLVGAPRGEVARLAHPRAPAGVQAGAAGEIKLKAETKYAVRKGGPAQRGTSLRKIDLDEDSGAAAAPRNAVAPRASARSSRSRSRCECLVVK